MADLESRVAALESVSAPVQGSQLNPLLWLGLLVAGSGLAWAFRRRDGLIIGGGR